MPLPTSKDTEYIKEYGIGIDCHSKFISISIRYRCGNNIEIAQKDFGTAWNDLIEGRDWCIKVLMEKADPIPDMSEPLHYVLESTANYHMPVCMAWGGNPTIINPTLAGATKRKTDRLDSELLALHDQLNIWRECYIPNEDIKTLRVMISERDRCIHDATATGNRINNTIIRFGFTIGKDGSVVRDPSIRALIEDQISDNPSDINDICPMPIPLEVRIVLRSEYKKFDYLNAQSEEWKQKIIEKAHSME